MLRYNQLQVARYNLLNRIKYNANPPSDNPLFTQLAGALPVVYSQNDERLAVLENADEPIIEAEVGEKDTLTFSLPFNDSKREFLQNENYVRLANKRYIIRRVTKIRTGSDLSIEVYCEATWYDLQEAEPMEVWEWTNATPKEMMQDMLRGTDWVVGIVEITAERNLSLDAGKVNRLEALRELPDLFDGELQFNTDNNTVDFVEEIGKESGAAIVYRKNMEEIEHEYSTEHLVTKLYLYGKDDLTIEDAHPEGLTYITNFNYTDKVKVQTMQDERFTNPYHLYEKGQNALEVMSRPTGSYIVKLSDLSVKTGMRHEQFGLGDSVWVFDKDLGINERKRIMKWTYNVKRPWDTEVELESKQPTLSDLLSGTDRGGSALQSEDAVSQDEMLDLSVFNYLKNSRGDDGFSYWQNQGWEIDSVNGYSGNSSFKATAEEGVTKELTQVVYPSHREQYAISLRASTQDLELGDNGEVGIYITIRYDDGSEDEPVFIPLT